jgi:hypothetical protein
MIALTVASTCGQTGKSSEGCLTIGKTAQLGKSDGPQESNRSSASTSRSSSAFQSEADAGFDQIEVLEPAIVPSTGDREHLSALFATIPVVAILRAKIHR